MADTNFSIKCGDLEMRTAESILYESKNSILKATSIGIEHLKV